VAKNIHFVFGLQDDELGLCDRLAIASAHHHNPDHTVYLWCPHEPAGKHWERLKRQVPVRVMPIENPHDWNGSEIRQYQHRADLIRHTVLYTMGGVYCDTDTITLAPFPKWWQDFDTVIGVEWHPGEVIGLCNAIMSSRMHSRFQWKWLERWQSFTGGGWNEVSVRYPLKLHKQNPGLAIPFCFGMLGFQHFEYHRYWEGIHDMRGCIVAHLWRTHSGGYMRAITERDIRRRNTTYAVHAAAHL